MKENICMETGRERMEISESPSKSLSIRIPNELYDKLETCDDFGDDRGKAYKIRRMMNFYFKYKDRVKNITA